MTLKQVAKKIKTIEEELRNTHSVSALFIFGSVARGNATSKSDIDILVDFATDKIGLFEFLDLKVFLESQLGVKVDLVTRDALKNWMKADVEKQAVRVA